MRATDNLGATTTSSPVTVAVAATGQPSSVFFIETDHLNTPRMITDGQGNVVWQWESEPFGSTPPEEFANTSGELFVFNLRFPGQYFDKETNLNYNYFRDYDPKIGRYIQSDPIGLNGGLNTYAYVLGNPISYTDPKGLAVPVAVAACMANPLCAAAAAAAVTATARACIDTAKAVRNWYSNSKEADVPYTGPPGEWIDGRRRSRKYGPDGKPEVDIDNPHQGMPDTHVHEWPGGVREHPGRSVPW